MKGDIEKTRHFTTKAIEICSNLISDIPPNALLIEPFVGKGDLLNLFPNNEWQLYDLESKVKGVIIQDTLLNPPNYCGKWVITNPPYLAQNKAKDKKLFQKYNLDDLYKISLKTFLKAEGGIVIIPTNFLTDERSEKIRKIFFDRFKIIRLNIFTKPIFNSTTYSVCAFSFIKHNGESEITFPTFLPQENKQLNITLEKKYGYRLAGEFYHKVEATNAIFARLVEGKEKGFLTKIKLYALDTRQEKIRLTYGEETYWGKTSDRIYATFVSKVELTEEEQKQIVEGFNSGLNEFRNLYGDIPLTNYRDFNRKRIGFDFAYKYATTFYGGYT